MTPALPTFGVVVLTQGRRHADLRAALDSVLRQRDVIVDVVCVGNGWQPTGLPDGVRAVALPTNLGIPAGRNAGVPHVEGEFLFFLDDDAELPDPDTLGKVAQRLSAGTGIGLVQPQVRDPRGAPAPRRWIPRVRKGRPEDPGPVFSVWEGAVGVRRDAFLAAGGWPDEFFYAHEGIELAWRVWDAGWTVWYAGDLMVHHPVINPERHALYYRLNARNRVWLARRNLPAVLRPFYVGMWTGVQILRSWRSPAKLRDWFAGWKEGWTTDPGPRRIMSWRTVIRMARHGRPPLV